MKRLCIGLAVALAGAGAMGETAYPLYVVETDSGTLEAPVSVETLGVTRYASAESEPETTDFATVAAEPRGAGTFVKRGTGYVMGSTAFTNFTGEVRVEKGAWVVDRPGMCGSNLSSANAPTFAVSNGAAFVCAATSSSFPTYGVWGSCLIRYTKFFFEGTGPDGLGALLNASSISMNCACWNTTMTLTGDTTFGETTAQRFDLGTSAVVDLQGHELVIKNHKSETTYYGVFTPDCTVKNPGSIRAEGTAILFQSSPTFNGDSSTRFTFDKGAALQTWNASMATARLPWTLYFTGNAALSISRSAAEKEFDESSNFFNSPVVIDQNRLYAYSATKGNGLALNGPVSGRGGFHFCSELSLALNCPTNTFEGTVAVNGNGAYTYSSVLRLGADGALPENGPGAKLTNAFLRLTKFIPYHLPQLDFHTQLARTTNYWAEGGSQGTVAGLRKTGAQTLEWRAPLSVTGLTEIVEGTLKLKPVAAPDILYSAVPGLYEWIIPNANQLQDPTMAYSIWNDPGWSVVSNNVVGAMEGLRQSTAWDAWSTHEWHGYVWNRTETNETWTFARGICGYSRLMIDRKTEYSSDNNGAIIRDNLTITPGPHEILFRVNARSYGGHGSGKNGVATWRENMGLAIDRFGRGTTNADDYVFLENGHLDAVTGGDGYWFTRDPRTREEFTEDELTAQMRSANFTAIRAHAGSVIDIAMPDAPTATPLVVQDFIGANTVTNGSLTITKSWTLLGGEMKAQPLLLTDGVLKFGSGATLDIADADLCKGGKWVEIARTKEGITGLPALSSALEDANWILKTEGNSLYIRHDKGLVLILR